MQRRLRHVSSINVIASIMFVMLGKQSGGIAWYAVTLSLRQSKDCLHKQNNQQIQD